MERTRRSRREFLQVSGVSIGVLCLAGLLQACGGAPATASNTPPSGAGSSSGPAASAASASAKPRSLPKLTASYGAMTGSSAPLWMAKAIGAFDKYGVSVDMQYIESNTAVAAMISGSLDVQEVSAASVITADVNGHQDIVIIASALNHPILGLYTAPSITNAEQLKGQVIASDKPGTPVDYGARVSLSLLGLKPTDVQLRPITATEIVPAMLSGQVPAGVQAPPQSFQLEAKGFHLLKDIYSQPYQNMALVAKRSRLDELAPALRPLLAAYRDAIQAWDKQPDVAMQVIDQYAKVGDPDILKKTYEFYRTTAPFQKDMQPTMEGIKAMMDFLSSTVPAVAEYKAEQFVDTRFLAELPK